MSIKSVKTAKNKVFELSFSSEKCEKQAKKIVSWAKYCEKDGINHHKGDISFERTKWQKLI